MPHAGPIGEGWMEQRSDRGASSGSTQMAAATVRSMLVYQEDLSCLRRINFINKLENANKNLIYHTPAAEPENSSVICFDPFSKVSVICKADFAFFLTGGLIVPLAFALFLPMAAVAEARCASVGWLFERVVRIEQV